MHNSLQGVEWGTVPAWFSAIITSGSLLVAAFSYRRSVLDKQSEQASKVAAWIALEHDRDEEKPVLRLRNSSDGPIFDVTVTHESKGIATVSELVPETTSSYPLDGSITDPTPRTIKAVSIEVQSIVAVGVSRETVLTAPSPTLVFRDSVGRWWQRDASGKLRQVQSRTKAYVYGFNLGPIRVSWRNVEDEGRYEVQYPRWSELPFWVPSWRLVRRVRKLGGSRRRREDLRDGGAQLEAESEKDDQVKINRSQHLSP